MKFSMLGIIASLACLVGVTLQANDLQEREAAASVIQEAVYLALDQEGDLKDLSGQEIAGTQVIIKHMVNDYLKDPNMDLTDGNVLFASPAEIMKEFFSSAASSLSAAAKAAVELAKKLIPKIAEMIKKIAPMALNAAKKAYNAGYEGLKKYGPKVMKTVLSIGKSLGLDPTTVIGMGAIAALAPVTPPGGQEGFLMAMRQQVLKALQTSPTFTNKDKDEDEDQVDEDKVDKEDVADMVDGAAGKETDPETKALLRKMAEEIEESPADDAPAADTAPEKKADAEPKPGQPGFTIDPADDR